jgi:hypothetical protein
MNAELSKLYQQAGLFLSLAEQGFRMAREQNLAGQFHLARATEAEARRNKAEGAKILDDLIPNRREASCARP